MGREEWPLADSVGGRRLASRACSTPMGTGMAPSAPPRSPPPVFLGSYPSLSDTRRRRPSAAAQAPQPPYLLFSRRGGDHRSGSRGSGPRWGGGQTGPGPPSGSVGRAASAPSAPANRAPSTPESSPRTRDTVFLNLAGLLHGPTAPPAARPSQSAPGPPFFKPSSGRQSGSIIH